MEAVIDSRSEKSGCLDSREIDEIGSGGDSDVASESSANACKVGHVPEDT